YGEVTAPTTKPKRRVARELGAKAEREGTRGGVQPKYRPAVPGRKRPRKPPSLPIKVDELNPEEASKRLQSFNAVWMERLPEPDDENVSPIPRGEAIFLTDPRAALELNVFAQILGMGPPPPWTHRDAALWVMRLLSDGPGAILQAASALIELGETDRFEGNT